MRKMTASLIIFGSTSTPSPNIMKWIPGHRNIEGNEAAEEAAQLNQQDVALDFNTMKSTIIRNFRKKWSAAVMAREGIYSHKPAAQFTNVTRLPVKKKL